MASISVVGKVVGREGDPAVSVKTFENGNQIASFSVVDSEYFYVKEGDERTGQFYAVEVLGKGAEIITDRLHRGDRVGVHGQLVQRKYNDKLYLTVKNARVVFQEPRPEGAAAGGRPANDEVPF
jgi:single-stranded DNA-binding protein